MTLLDSHTTLILATLLFLLLPLLVAWVTRGHRHRDVIWWCAGSLCASLGLLLIAQREWLPTLVSYHAANTCLLTSLLLWSQSLRVFLGRPWTGTIVLVSVAAAAVFYGVIHAVLDMPTRSATTRLALAALSLQTAWLALQVTRQSGSHNAAAISVSHLLLGLALGVQGLMFLENGTVAASPFSRTTDASIVALAALITAMIGHFCISGLVLERSTQRQIEALEASAAAEETVLLDAQLRKLDREDRLLLVSGSLAHKLNQPLTAALTHAQVAGRRLQLDKADTAAIDDLLAKIAASARQNAKRTSCTIVWITRRLRSSAIRYSSARCLARK
jgi:hypothetical protein